MIALAAVLIISTAILLWQYVRGDLEDAQKRAAKFEATHREPLAGDVERCDRVRQRRRAR